MPGSTSQSQTDPHSQTYNNVTESSKTYNNVTESSKTHNNVTESSTPKKSLEKLLAKSKTNILKATLTWITRWIHSSPNLDRREELLNLTTFTEIKIEIRVEYDSKWLETGLRFLKFAFIQLVTHARMTELQAQSPADAALLKYTREQLLLYMDGLHTKKAFEDQTIENYPERSIPRCLQYKKRPKVDINEDPDADLSDEEGFAESEHSEDEYLHNATLGSENELINNDDAINEDQGDGNSG
ncbi:hypothetical protein BDR22DRAFT_823857 [Usnea florida]